jgi:predicted transcriptional regulator
LKQRKKENNMLKKFSFTFIFVLLLLTVVEAATYYGQVLIKNTPVQGLEVSAEWLDLKGIYHRTSTKTLTREQAVKKGDSQFEGYYFFDGGSVYPQEDTNIVFSFSNFPYNLIVRTLPGQSVVRLNTVSFHYESSYSNQTVEANQTQENFSYTQEEITQMILSNSTAVIIVENETVNTGKNISKLISGEKVSEEINATQNILPKGEPKKSNFLQDLLLVLVLVILLGLVFGLGYLFIKQGTVYIGKTIDEYSPVLQKPKKIAETKVKNITNKLSFISPKEEISQAISLVSTSEDNCVILMKDGEYYGYLKEKDLIVYQGEYTRRISENQNLICKDNIIIDSNKKVEEAFSIMDELGVTTLIVKEGGKIIGQVSGIDILKLVSSFKFPQGAKEKQNIPLIRDILDKDCPCAGKETTIKEVTREILEQKTDIILIQDERYIGEITSDDLLSGIIKYGQSFKDTKVGLVMSSIHSLNPDSDIFEACDYIIERGFSSYPVIINETLLGVIRPMKLLKEIIKFIK